MAKYKKLGETLVYKSKLVELYEDHLELPDGRQVVYDLLKHSGGAAVLPVDEEGRLVLIRQYRNSVDQEVYEIPAGLREPEDHTGEICARRELEEETGYHAEHLEFIAQAYGIIGFSNEKTDIYLAEHLVRCERHLDPDENIEIYRFSLKEALEMIQRKEIIDAKTIIAILYYHMKQQEEE
ncbi:MAG: NUDIX hydrolase [Lachnospiraceae bacterium]|nr:NUDIX hydrolase [Lachnospiraceae bacterium]MBP3507059.1 NUDIX hydrolase [Lachnospiraceae bacterium]